MGRPFLWLSLLWLASDLKWPSIIGTASSSGKAKLVVRKARSFYVLAWAPGGKPCWWPDAEKARPYHSSLWGQKAGIGVFERRTLEPTVLLHVGDVLRYAGRKALLQVDTGSPVYGIKVLGTGGLALPGVPASMVCKWRYVERWRTQWGNAKWKTVSLTAYFMQETSEIHAT